MKTTTQTPPSWPALDLAAADAGVDPVTFLVQQASILAAIAAPECGWQGPAGLERGVTPNLMLPEPGSLQQRLLAQQLDTPRSLQARLRATSGQFRHEILEFARYGLDPGKSKDAGAGYLSMCARERHGNAIGLDPTHGEGSAPADFPMNSSIQPDFLQGDLHLSVPAVREEALRRPTFLLENPGLAQLQRHAATLHRGHGLVVGMLGNLTRKPRRRGGTAGGADERGLADFLAGFDTRLPEAIGMKPLNADVRVKVTGILATTNTELRRLMDADPALLDRFALIRSAGPPAPSNTPAGNVESLLKMMPHAVSGILAKRRNGEGILHEMRDPTKARRFHHQRIAFMAKLDDIAEPVAGLASVPVSLAWALVALYPGSDADDLILGVAVPFAEVLLERHLAILAGLEEVEAETDVEPELEIAIVERIRKHGPLTDRQLVRKFRVQRKDVHQPAIDRLLSEGVLVRDDQGRLCLGPAVAEFERAVAH